jgi:hypothetical protein
MRLNSFLCKILDLSYVPDEIRALNGQVVMHISDTPSTFYNCLDRLIKILDPPWILHTGDLVDQIKVGRHQRDRELYALKLRRLRSILEYGVKNENRKTVITLGNHDIEEVVRHTFRKSIIENSRTCVEIGNLKFYMSHYYSLLPGGAGTYNLYGHNIQQPPQDTSKGIFLNGVLQINLIRIKDGEVYSLPYPRYVDEHRTLRHKIGL